MSLLLPSEYNVNYFDGYLDKPNQHPAGYYRYDKWYRWNDDFVPVSGSTGEYFADLAAYYNTDGFLEGKKVLELGCAKGYIVEWLRGIGIDTWGMDISEYAITQATSSIQSYLINANAVTELEKYKKNDFDVIISRGFICCLSDTELVTIISLMNKVGVSQIHHIWAINRPEYYNIKTITEALTLPFKNGTILIKDDDIKSPYTV